MHISGDKVSTYHAFWGSKYVIIEYLDPGVVAFAVYPKLKTVKHTLEVGSVYI